MAKPLIEVKDVDREFYEKHIREWLPDKIIDIHTHIWLARHRVAYQPVRMQTWPRRVARENPVEHLVETYRRLFPGKIVTPLMFTTLVSEKNFDQANDYVARVARERKFPALIFSRPQWSGKELARRIRAGGFVGAKSYLSLSPSCLPAAEIRIFDFFPHHQLEVLNKHGLIMMLHIPRDNRLRDPVNLAQMMEIDEYYPDIKLIRKREL